MQGSGHVADIIRVWGLAWVVLQRGLVCIIKTSFQKASRILAPGAVNTVKNCCAERRAVVLSVLLLLWLAHALRGPCFFRVGFRAFWRARARPQPQIAAIYGVLLLLRFRAGLRAVLFGLLFLRPLARVRARDLMSAFWSAHQFGLWKASDWLVI